MAFEIFNNNQVTPPRLHAMVRLVPLLREPSRKDLFDLLQPTSALPQLNNQTAADGVFTAARSCGLLMEDEGVVRLRVLPEAVETFASFQRHLQGELLGIIDDSADHYLLNLFAAWYAVQDDRVFKFDLKEFEVRFNDEMFPGSESRHFNTTKLPGWRVWAAFLGLGWSMRLAGRDLVVPDAHKRLEPLLPKLLPEGEQAVAFSGFMDLLADHCPELDGGTLFRQCAQASRGSDQTGNRLSLMLSNALRVLHESGRIHLSLQPDAITKWTLYPAVGHKIGQVSHIQLGRSA